MEICPNCGDYTQSLDDYTGWCRSCSTTSYRSQDCARCNRALDGGKEFCRSCRESIWLEEHGDEIDRVLTTGVPKSTAIDIVKKNQYKPRCLVCGNPMRKPSIGEARFCKKTVICKRASIRFKGLVYVKKIDREEALKEVLQNFSVVTEETAHADNIST